MLFFSFGTGELLQGAVTMLFYKVIGTLECISETVIKWPDPSRSQEKTLQ